MSDKCIFDPVKRESGVNPERTRRCNNDLYFRCQDAGNVMSLGNREDEMKRRF